MTITLSRKKMYIPHEARALALGPWLSSNLSHISLDAAGLVALADLTTIARRTALMGTSSPLDILVLCPGLHREQAAPALNCGEYPACAAMTSGHIFRVENEATSMYLQKVGRTGSLTTISARRQTAVSGSRSLLQRAAQSLIRPFSATDSVVANIAYGAAVVLTLLVLVILALSADWWGLFVIGILVLVRACNVAVIAHRTRVAWHGAPEPDVMGDLLILVSQDKWIRMQGSVDDLKAVTSGQWMQDANFVESSVSALATVLVYLDAALANNTSQMGQILLLVVLIISAGLLAISNEMTQKLRMHGVVLEVNGDRMKFSRRLEMANMLIEETGRRDWAVRLGMVVPDREAKEEIDVPATL